jgi:hypothetical protein
VIGTRTILLKDWKPITKNDNLRNQENWKGVDQEIGTDGDETKIASVFQKCKCFAENSQIISGGPEWRAPVKKISGISTGDFTDDGGTICTGVSR